MPITLIDVRLEAGASVEQIVPASYNGFFYVLEGEARIGEARTPRQGIPIVSYGPFIGDTRDDIARAFEQYRAGTFRRY